MQIDHFVFTHRTRDTNELIVKYDSHTNNFEEFFFLYRKETKQMVS